MECRDRDGEKLCLNTEQVCDIVPDCADGADEADCGEHCNPS